MTQDTKQPQPSNRRFVWGLGVLLVACIGLFVWLGYVPLMASWYFQRASQGEDTSFELAELGPSVGDIAFQRLQGSLASGKSTKAHHSIRITAFQVLRRLRYRLAYKRKEAAGMKDVWYVDVPLSSKDKQAISAMVRAFESIPTAKVRNQMLVSGNSLDFRFSYALQAGLWNSKARRTSPYNSLPQPEFAPKSTKKAVRQAWCQSFAPVLRSIISGRHPVKAVIAPIPLTKAPWELLRWQCNPKQDREAVRAFFLRLVMALQPTDDMNKLGTVWKKERRPSFPKPIPTAFARKSWSFQSTLWQWFDFLARKEKLELLDEQISPFLQFNMGCHSTKDLMLVTLALPKRKLPPVVMKKLFRWLKRLSYPCAKVAMPCTMESHQRCLDEAERRFRKMQTLLKATTKTTTK